MTFPAQIFADFSSHLPEKTQLHDIRNILRKTVSKTLEKKHQSEVAFSLYSEILGVELGWNYFERRHLFEDFLFVCDEISDFNDSN